MRKYIGLIVILLVAFAAIMFTRGSEDRWICDGGVWVEHGNPSASKPDGDCEGERDCASLDIDKCTGECVVCPPCPECSSISCQTEEFCKGIGFDKDWHEGIKKKISNFKECIDAGNPAMESYPRQCRTGDETFTEYIGNELEKQDMIILNQPRPNQEISSPLVVEGEARGMWFFEADFPVVLTDWDGKIISVGIARAEGDWMTEDFVKFRAELEFEKPEYKNNGSLILRKDNPSDLPENDDALEIPIYFK